jgi:hypothetical protein
MEYQGFNFVQWSENFFGKKLFKGSRILASGRAKMTLLREPNL